MSLIKIFKVLEEKETEFAQLENFPDFHLLANVFNMIVASIILGSASLFAYGSKMPRFRRFKKINKNK